MDGFMNCFAVYSCDLLRVGLISQAFLDCHELVSLRTGCLGKVSLACLGSCIGFVALDCVEGLDGPDCWNRLDWTVLDVLNWRGYGLMEIIKVHGVPDDL